MDEDSLEKYDEIRDTTIGLVEENYCSLNPSLKEMLYQAKECSFLILILKLSCEKLSNPEKFNSDYEGKQAEHVVSTYCTNIKTAEHRYLSTLYSMFVRRDL